ncbi:hypothetical protein AYO21_08944 [Fonsecaea monophora]|uniref:Major facilitator superfamily (MFS) profile domain-containing protein n=1 Tax=Fonsecaea monophora TaxID=254056 RepID=A0A177EZW0_9EURO|nr:hypothetical protein AYO21_08944 [Fonsecaea monophora]KAH0837456.1 Benomyl/methotrexate resistance protein [Fonsecaea pedrosoi]OAG36871.1 hypothetical protein AYO21_08944 [Fonsecaea monophora]
MLDTIRDAPLGQFLRWITQNRILLYPDEREGFVLPKLASGTSVEDVTNPDNSVSDPVEAQKESPETQSSEKAEDSRPDSELADLEKAGGSSGPSTRPTRRSNDENLEPSLARQRSLSFTEERYALDQQLELEKTNSKPISLYKSADGTILVDWYTTDDPENPQNWSQAKKLFILVQICGVMHRFGVGEAAAAMGLAIYVIGYGVGPLLFAPLCEIPAIGRNGVYTPAFILFTIICIPTAVVDNYAGLLVLRFLQGFLSSPCLANGAASVSDMFSLLLLPVYLSSWTGACFWGPALGPVMASYAVSAKGWRWSLWELLWLSAPILVVYLIAFPETSGATILRRRAARLRKLTGRTDLRSQSEIDQEHMKYSEVFFDAIIKPLEIMMKDPAVAYTNLYSALLYGIYYSFFEAFPLVYVGIYGFNLGELGLTFVTIGVGCTIAVVVYNTYLLLYLVPDIIKNGLRAPEHRLVPALFGVCTLPAGLFMFGWTSRHGVHWIVSTIGVIIVVCSNFVIFQCIFVYLPLSYPRYTASLLASNDLFRSLFAAGTVIFSRPMFVNLGIGPGISLLAGLACAGVVGMFLLWRIGGMLRARSKFAVG